MSTKTVVSIVLGKVDIVKLAQECLGKGVVRKKGKDYWTVCPFHKERTPSCSFVPQEQFFYCFGCGAGGSALDFLQSYYRIPRHEALVKLISMYGLSVPYGRTNQRRARRRSRRKK